MSNGGDIVLGSGEVPIDLPQLPLIERRYTSHLNCHIQLLIRPDQGGRTSAVNATAGTRNAHYQGRLFPDFLRHRPTVKQMLLQLRLSTYVHHEHLLTRRKILLRAVPVKLSR